MTPRSPAAAFFARFSSSAGNTKLSPGFMRPSTRRRVSLGGACSFTKVISVLLLQWTFFLVRNMLQLRQVPHTGADAFPVDDTQHRLALTPELREHRRAFERDDRQCLWVRRSHPR